jgi:hypothetical protein
MKRRFLTASIIADENSLGRVILNKVIKIKQNFHGDPKNITIAKKEIISFLAGPCAENKFIRKRLPWVYSDFEEVVGLIDKLIRDNKAAQKYLYFMWAQTYYIVDNNWQATKIIAKELIKHKCLSYYDIKKLTENKIFPVHYIV